MRRKEQKRKREGTKKVLAVVFHLLRYHLILRQWTEKESKH